MLLGDIACGIHPSIPNIPSDPARGELYTVYSSPLAGSRARRVRGGAIASSIQHRETQRLQPD
jgi:hypothetical protein